MIRKKCDEIEWLEFELLACEPRLIHAVFLRHGGVSLYPYDSLNLEMAVRNGKVIQDFESELSTTKGTHSQVVDDASVVAHPDSENCVNLPFSTASRLNHIIENRRRSQKVLNIEHMTEGIQVHGDVIERISQRGQLATSCDGLMTDQLNQGLMIKHADCQAAIFYDPVHNVLANVHCGWQGNVKNIYRAAVQNMILTFGSDPKNLLVGIAPSLGPNHSEFINYKIEFPENLWQFQVKSNYFDLWAMARHQLEQCGLLPHHIQIASICTFANSQDYFSYRRDKITGRHATVAMLKKS